MGSKCTELKTKFCHVLMLALYEFTGKCNYVHALDSFNTYDSKAQVEVGDVFLNVLGVIGNNLPCYLEERIKFDPRVCIAKWVLSSHTKEKFMLLSSKENRMSSLSEKCKASKCSRNDDKAFFTDLENTLTEMDDDELFGTTSQKNLIKLYLYIFCTWLPHS